MLCHRESMHAVFYRPTVPPARGGTAVNVAASCTIRPPSEEEDTLRMYNHFANVAPLVDYSGLQEPGTGSDGSYNIGWIQTSLLHRGPQFPIPPTIAPRDPPVTATAIPFLDRFEIEEWYEDYWGFSGENLLPPAGPKEVIARYKDVCIVPLGGTNGWLMLACRDLVRRDVAITNGYPAAVTADPILGPHHCFPDNPGVIWPYEHLPFGAFGWVYPSSGPYRSGSATTESGHVYDAYDLRHFVAEKCEYLADIVAFWCRTENFAEDVIGPFWIRPSLVTAAAPDETGDAHAAIRPRYWYGVPGAVLMDEDSGEDEPKLYVYFVKDTCYHNHADRVGSVGLVGSAVTAGDAVDPGTGTMEDRLTTSEHNYYSAMEEPAKIILRKITVRAIMDKVNAAREHPEITDQRSWNETHDPIVPLIHGEEYEVSVYDYRPSSSTTTGLLFADVLNVGLAGPMPALSPNGTLLLFLVVAQAGDYHHDGIWWTSETSVTTGAERGAEFAVTTDTPMVGATGPGHDANFYDPDPVFVPAPDGMTGTWYLFTGWGQLPRITCWSAPESVVGP